MDEIDQMLERARQERNARRNEDLRARLAQMKSADDAVAALRAMRGLERGKIEERQTVLA